MASVREQLASARSAKTAKFVGKQSRTHNATHSRTTSEPSAPHSPPTEHVNKKAHVSPEPTTISPSGLFENEVSTYFLEQSLRNENEQLRLRLQSLEQQYTQLQTQHTQARQATAPTTASPSTTTTPTPQPAAQQTGPQLVWTHTKSFFTASDSHIRVYYKSLSHIMQSMA